MNSSRLKEKSNTMIRMAGPEDVTEIVRMCRELGGYELSLLPEWARRIQEHWERGFTPERVEEMISDPEKIVLVAETRNGKKVGFLLSRVMVADDGFKEGEIQTVFVRENSRGKRIGSELMKRAEEILREKGCQAVSVVAYSYNTTAKKFYSSAGYSLLMESFKKNLSHN